MTNRKFKDYQKNRVVFAVINKNYELLCTLLLTLNKLFPKNFYSKKCIEWINDYEETCRTADEWDKDDVLNYKLDQGVKTYGIDVNKITQLVERRCRDLNRHNKRVLVDNVKLALIQTAHDYGIGKKRMEILQDELIKERIENPAKEIGNLGISNIIKETNVGQVDYRKYKYSNKLKTTYDECQKARAGLEAFRRWTNENVITGDE